MKQLIRHTLASLLLTIVGAAGTAYAQYASTLKVNIPFDFTFGDKIFSAGDYSLTQPLQHYLVLRDARGQSIAVTLTNGVESLAASATSKLMFRSVDGRKVLSEVWHQNDSSGEELPSTKTNTRSYITKHRSSDQGQTVEASQP